MKRQAIVVAADVARQQRLRYDNSLTLTSLPEAMHIKILKFIAIEEELSKLIRVSKQFSDIICHKKDDDDDEFQITIFKKEFSIPVITVCPKIKSCVGSKIGKSFGKKYYKGNIISYNHQTGFYKVKYTDGDEEEMDEDDIERYRLPRKQKIWHGHHFLASPKGVIKKLRFMNLHHCRHMIVKDVDMFEDPWVLRHMYRDYHLHQIVSLNMALPLPTNGVKNSMPCILAEMLPNLREMDISNINMDKSTLLPYSLQFPPKLEKLTWNNYNGLNLMDCGYLSRANNLKQLYIDNSTYSCSYYNIELMSDLRIRGYLDNGGDEYLDYENTNFIFDEFCDNLERVSVRNFNAATPEEDNEYSTQHLYPEALTPLPQTVLIKFVQNTPSLRWFRSDLTKANIRMLQLSYPEIEFLN